MQSMFDERLWLAWLVKVRIIILTFLLGIELAISRLSTNPLPLRLFIETILLWYAISIFYLFLLSFWDEYRVQSIVQVLTDLVLVSLVVYSTGGEDSSLNFLYPLVVIVASVLLPKWWTYVSAALAFIAYGTVLELGYYGIIQSYSTTHADLRALEAIILVNLFAYLAIAYLASLLASKLRQVDFKLKHTSGELRNLQALHENVIQAISCGLITTGLDGHITMANTTAQKLLNRTEDQLLNQPVSGIFLDSLPQLESDNAHGEVRVVMPNAFRKTFRVTVSALTALDGETLGCVYTFDDLTDLRRLEREVRMQDRLAAVGRLASAIAHEIRNPLTSIAGSVQMLSGIPDLRDDHRQLLEIVTRESERLNNIITDFLAYSRGKQYRFARVDLIPLLEDTLTLLEHRFAAQNANIQIVRAFGVREAMILGDGDKIKQVFWNFCENAVRAMKNEGTLTISIEQAGEEWQLNFADTGPGMSAPMTEKVFEPFQSQFEGGTGLGLAIVYQIVQAHEGKVWARSRPGEGCVFVLRLRRYVEGGVQVTTKPRGDDPYALQALPQLNAVSATAGGAHG